MDDFEIPDERIRTEPPVADPTLGTPWSRVPPFSHWQGSKFSVLELPSPGKPVWILYSWTNPTAFEKLEFKKSSEWYKVFHYYTGKERRERWLQVGKSDLRWDHYNNERFGAVMDQGAWVDVDAGKKLTKNQLTLIGQEEESETERYKRNPYTGIVKIFPTGKEDDTIIIPELLTPYEELLEEIKKYREKHRLDWDIYKKDFDEENQRAWYHEREHLEKINEMQEIKDCKEAVMKKNWGQIPELTNPQPIYSWRESCEAKGIKSVEYWEEKDEELVTIFPSEGESGVSDQNFVATMLLPELYLYPKSFLKMLDDMTIEFCGPIKHKETGQVLFFTTNKWGTKLYINSKKKSVMKMQQAFHQFICEQILKLFNKIIPTFQPIWKNLNPPGFVYDETIKQAPERITGFLTFQSLLTYENDVKDIYFALMKDPKTVLEHSDAIIAKKAQFLKEILSKLHSCLDKEWWQRVQDYEDIWELTLGTKEFFKEVNLKNLESPEKKRKE